MSRVCKKTLIAFSVHYDNQLCELQLCSQSYYDISKVKTFIRFTGIGRITSKTATNQNGHSQNGHKLDQNGHTEHPKRPQTKTMKV